ncbi:MAG TPA: hypothetical protein VK479_12115 [Micropepsaceae bacterium]|nr:hypothetical protein [Micropepsaceae bacterium]
MRVPTHGTHYSRPVLSTATAILFLSASLAPSYGLETSLDAYRQSGWAVPTGPAAMVRLHIPFGDNAKKRSRPSLSLSAGMLWRSEFGSQEMGGFRYTPGLEAGFTFGGEPILRLGTFDVDRLLAAQSDPNKPGALTDASTYCESNWLVCVGGGIVGVGLLGLIGNY